MHLDPWRPIASGRYLGTDPSKRFPIYTRGNAGEVFPEVQYPLSFTSSSDPSARGPGDVLVAPITDPTWTPLFVPAEAVVVDVGAMLSHACPDGARAVVR